MVDGEVMAQLAGLLSTPKQAAHEALQRWQVRPPPPPPAAAVLRPPLLPPPLLLPPCISSYLYCPPQMGQMAGGE